jgi:DNA topoisomerase I
LLESTLIRVGNMEYAKSNKSFGLTTLHDKHVDVQGEQVHFAFRGKSGVKHTIDIRDRRLARVVKQCRDIPGQHLFQYVDADGQRVAITSSDVNRYLKEISGEDFTAKDFRTWGGTVVAAAALRDLAEFESETQAKKNIVAAINAASQQLGNTKTVCRKY